ncbi:MAG: SufD family Fe-S cluster assembly protein [Lachnospiraceae bacterium]|nr:SufD family Fe-S cluster assembly protein [Lachnospiraceae bacterium]
MANIDAVTQSILEKIDGAGFKQEGAYNLRYNGHSLCHGNTEHIKIVRKEDKQGIDVYISKETKGETIHIPVVVATSGMTDEVYNDFHIEDGAEVVIIAGCGIHNSGCNDSRHDGIHTFHVGKYCNVRYEEKHYGEGEGTGARILNPVTKIIMDEASVFTLDTAQIEGVDSTRRETEIIMGAESKLFVTERLMTHDKQKAVSNMDVYLNGAESSAQIISRSVAKGESMQIFHPKAIGSAPCHAHIQCDSIIMNQARVCSIPEIDAKHIDAAIIHEAAIGRINNEQLIKLNTFGLSEEEAEAVIIENFLN